MQFNYRPLACALAFAASRCALNFLRNSNIAGHAQKHLSC